jgi:ComF family protein
MTIFGLRYEGTARELIHLFKFSGRESLAGTVSRILCAQLHRKVEMDNINLIIPVPLHINRLFARGYNQSYLIAREVGRVFLLPVATGILARRVNTPSQRTLTRAKRLLNMKKAFTTRNSARLDGKRILLVDDIMTTGATMFAAARALKKSGARSVVGAVAARA